MYTLELKLMVLRRMPIAERSGGKNVVIYMEYKDELKSSFQNFNSLRTQDHRSTFDYCYGYFYNNRGHLCDDIEKSCMILWSYLASWGMLRGSSGLLQKSPAALIPLIEFIDKSDEKLWEIDVPNYDNENNLNKIWSLYKGIKKILLDKQIATPTDTLVTKIMLGVYANVPAFDQYFTSFLKIQGNTQKFGKKSLKDIYYFYKKYQKVIDNIASVAVLVFPGSTPIKAIYTIAKIIDMIGFTLGQKKSDKKLKQSKSKKQ